MRILVLGAYGFIGSAVIARLSADGHEVVGAGRRIGRAARIRPDLRWLKINLLRMTRPNRWKSALQNIDAVVNCAGVLQDTPVDSTEKVHSLSMAALFEACSKADVKRVVQISAVGVGPHVNTSFSKTKLAGEEALKKHSFEWVILRPSLVVGRSAYGGTALLRALAALPFVVPIARESASFQPVQVTDLASAVSFFMKPDAPMRRTIEIAGPERITLEKMVNAYRRWIGLPPGETFRLPLIGAKAIAWLGDIGGWLGWRPPFRSNSLKQLSHSLAENPEEWTRITGIQPVRFDSALMMAPASVADLWFARLYLLKPIMIGVLAFYWIVSGVVGLGPALPLVKDILVEVGFGPWSDFAAVVSGLVQLALGLGIVFRSTARFALPASLLVAIIYVAAGGLMRLGLWIDPLGSLIKMFPLIALTIATFAVFDDR